MTHWTIEYVLANASDWVICMVLCCVGFYLTRL